MKNSKKYSGITQENPSNEFINEMGYTIGELENNVFQVKISSSYKDEEFLLEKVSKKWLKKRIKKHLDKQLNNYPSDILQWINPKLFKSVSIISNNTSANLFIYPKNSTSLTAYPKDQENESTFTTGEIDCITISV
jgi:hypothetical protein